MGNIWHDHGVRCFQRPADFADITRFGCAFDRSWWSTVAATHCPPKAALQSKSSARLSGPPGTAMPSLTPLAESAFEGRLETFSTAASGSAFCIGFAFGDLAFRSEDGLVCVEHVTLVDLASIRRLFQRRSARCRASRGFPKRDRRAAFSGNCRRRQRMPVPAFLIQIGAAKQILA